MPNVLLDAASRRRSPATTPGFHAGRPPRNTGRRYPADPPKVQAIVAVMRAAGDGRHGQRLRALIVVLWRAGLRISEALAVRERPRPRSRRRSRPSRQGSQAAAGRHGSVGVGAARPVA
jgi:integrase